MIKYLDDCVGCAIPCIDCGRKKSPHLCCDACGDDVEKVHILEGYEQAYLCDECLEELIKSLTKTYTLEELI